MRRTPCVLLFAVAACAGAEVIAPTASQVLAESSDDAPTRLTISGDEVVAIASPIDVHGCQDALWRGLPERNRNPIAGTAKKTRRLLAPERVDRTRVVGVQADGRRVWLAAAQEGRWAQ